MRLVACLIALALIPTFASAKGSLYLDPPRASYEVDEVFDVQVRADTAGDMINAAEAELAFDPRSLSVERLSIDGSILGSFSTEPSFSNTDGRVRFSGWTNEPYIGNDGLLLTISFRALRATASNARLVAGAALALEQGSNIIESMRSGLYTAGPQETAPEASEEPLSGAEGEASEDAEGMPHQRATLPGIPTVEVISPIRVGEQIIVRGMAEPRSRVWVRVTGPSLEGDAVVASGENGAYEYVSGEIAKDGVYRVTAFVEGADGMRSEASERVIVDVQLTPIVARLSAAAGLMSAALPFIALLLFAGLVGGFLLHHRARHRH